MKSGESVELWLGIGSGIAILIRVDREGPWKWYLSKDLSEVESELCLLKGLQIRENPVSLSTPTMQT